MNTQVLKKFKVLLIGDNCVDEYYYGSCDRLSPEAPVPVFKIVYKDTKPGMASNVKQNLENLNITVDFISNTEDILKSRYIDQRSGQHLIRVDAESKIKCCEKSQLDNLSGYDAIVISDYNKGFLTYEIIEHIIKTSSCPIFIDTKKTDLEKFSSDLVYIKINETEYKNRTSDPKNLIVTLGSKGAMFKQLSQEKTYPTIQVGVTDVCGCGDTFLAALVYKYLEERNIDNSIIFANKAASITVQHIGVYAPTLEEIK